MFLLIPKYYLLTAFQVNVTVNKTVAFYNWIF